MAKIAGKKSGLVWAVHLSVVALVILWLLPTAGLFVSSFRTADQISTSGWWSSLFSQEQNLVLRTAAPSTQQQEGNLWVIEGNLLSEGGASAEAAISVWGHPPAPLANMSPARLRRWETMLV